MGRDLVLTYVLTVCVLVLALFLGDYLERSDQNQSLAQKVFGKTRRSLVLSKDWVTRCTKKAWEYVKS